MTIGMIAFWALIIYAVVWLARGRPGGQDQQAPAEPPGEILKRRLAQGEISIEEYERLRTAIHPPAGKPVSAAERRSAA